MPKLALLPERVRVRDPAPDAPIPQPRASGRHLYFAFLSYSHCDEASASWLHDQLEKFRVPSSIAGRLTDNGIVPKRLTPIFRDRRELAAGGELGDEIKDALAASRFLIVICSRTAARSRWTNAEIDLFKRSRPDGCVIAAIVDGEPFASGLPGREDEECLPPALRVRYDRRGRPTGKRAEPLAADLRDDRDGKRLGLLKIVAGILGVGLDDLVQRETLRRQRRLGLLAAASIAGMVVTTGLAVTAIEARDAARDQRREAEGLVGFMLGDLKERLEPIGRLDVLDSVAARALAYYEKQDEGRLSDDGLAQRSRALTLMGEIANMRGDLATALRFYRRAFVSTEEALSRAPDDPQRMFDHAQNVFWVGYIDRQRGEVRRAETAFREYDRLARAMVAADPSSTRWRLEQAYASNALGVLLLDTARYPDAGIAFGDALRVAEGLIALEPQDRSFQDRYVEALAWLADAREGAGALDQALELRQRQMAYLERLATTRAADATIKRQIMTSQRVLGRLLASRGDSAGGLAKLQIAAALVQEMLEADPQNTEWGQVGAHTLFDQGELQLAVGEAAAAPLSITEGCRVARALAAKDSSVVEWRSTLPARCLALRTRMALAEGRIAEAHALATELVKLRRGEITRHGQATNFALAEAELLRGDVISKMGDREAARSAWLAASAAWPRDVALNPRQMALQAGLFRRLGSTEESRRVSSRLAAIGYRHPAYISA